MQTPPLLILSGWSERTNLYPSISIMLNISYWNDVKPHAFTALYSSGAHAISIFTQFLKKHIENVAFASKTK